MSEEIINVSKDDILFVLKRLEDIKASSIEEVVKEKITILSQYISKNILEEDENQEVSFEDLISEKMQEMRDKDKELYNLLYFLYRNYQNGKVDETTAWDMLNKYIKAIYLRYGTK